MTKYIIVLGNENPEIYKKRVDRAIQYFHTLKVESFVDALQKTQINVYFIMSGGRNGAVNMKKYAIEQGIDPKYIVTEEKSQNTIENLIFSLEYIQKCNMGCFISITVCTSTFHSYRTFALMNYYMKDINVNLIHTNENVSDELKLREMQLLYMWLNSRVLALNN